MRNFAAITALTGKVLGYYGHSSKACSKISDYKFWQFMLQQFRKLLILKDYLVSLLDATPYQRWQSELYTFFISRSFTDVFLPYFKDFRSLHIEEAPKIWSHSGYLITYAIISTLFKNQILYAFTVDSLTFFRWSCGSQHKNPFCGRSSTTRHNIIPVSALKERTE